MEYNLRIN